MTDQPNAARSLRIVYVWDADYPWDVRVEKTCRALTDAGHDVHIVARNRKWSPTTERLPEGTVHRMTPWRWAGRSADAALGFPAFFSPRWRRLIARVAKQVSADIIIARDLPLCPTAIRVGRRFGIPVILDMAENYPAMLQAIWTAKRARFLDYIIRNPRNAARVERYCLKRATQVWVVSEAHRDLILTSGSMDPRRITVIGNTPPRCHAQTEWVRRDRAGIEIVYLGLLEIPRGVGDVIAAVARLRARGVAVTLKLIGNGRDEGVFRRQAADLGLASGTVVFAGFLPYEAAIEAIAHADIGATPLHRNGHMDSTVPNKLFDYMGAGIPVLTSDVTASAQIVRSLRVGEVFESENPESLEAAVMRLEDPARRAAMGERGRQAVLSVYNWESDSAALVGSVENQCCVPARTSGGGVTGFIFSRPAS